MTTSSIIITHIHEKGFAFAFETNENESVKRQSKQNISAKGDGNVKSKSRVVDSSDQSDANVTANANSYANEGGDEKIVKKKKKK